MAEVLGSVLGQVSQRRRERPCRSGRWFALALGSALLSFGVATAQITPARQAKKDAAAKVVPAAAPAISTPVAAPAPTVAELPPMAPARPPVVSWDGKLLTIDAENSTLSDVLLAIRSRTGASIEMPGSASQERVALHVGPAPIREVLSSLLYGTNFNYVIQASENDESGLGKLILSSRDGGDADEVSGDVRADRNIRLMPGYAAPGKRDFQVAHERAAAAAEAENSADTSSQETTQPAGNEVVSNEPTPTDSQPVATNNNSSDSSASSPASPDTTLTAAEQPLSRTVTGITSSTGTDSSANDGPNISNMETSLQKMYQQRRQIQAQQNQPPQQNPAP